MSELTPGEQKAAQVMRHYYDRLKKIEAKVLRSKTYTKKFFYTKVIFLLQCVTDVVLSINETIQGEYNEKI